MTRNISLLDTNHASALLVPIEHMSLTTCTARSAANMSLTKNVIPTRAALRALARVCQGDSFFPSQCRPKTLRRSIAGCSTRNYAPPRLRPVNAIQDRAKTTMVDAPEAQSFVNDPSRYNPQHPSAPEPKGQDAGDLQNEASGPLLPDISNYYTLFPKTIPHGPPQKTSPQPDSSHLPDHDPSGGTFYINPRDLRKEFLQLQSRHHPDKYPAGSVAHRRAYALSTLLNNAYRTLADPLLRAQYLLQMLYGIDVTNEDNSAHPSDPETLLLVMEAQEELEMASGKDGHLVVQRLREENKARIRESEKELENAFQAGDAERARDESVKLKYWRSLEGGLQDWEPGKEVRLTH